MDDTIANKLLPFFPLLFVGMWLLTTSVLGVLSGWFNLCQIYPDTREPALLTLRGRSGSMGFGVNLQRVLRLEACRSGLRVRISRLFGPFQPPFLVPWNEIAATPRTSFCVPMIRLGFGRPENGKLAIEVRSWEQLAPFAGTTVTAAPAAIEQAKRRVVPALVLQWAVLTAFMGTFFYWAPRMMPVPGPAQQQAFPLVVCFAFPAVVVGFGQVLRYFRG
jgi:hypothetical protein